MQLDQLCVWTNTGASRQCNQHPEERYSDLRRQNSGSSHTDLEPSQQWSPKPGHTGAKASFHHPPTHFRVPCTDPRTVPETRAPSRRSLIRLEHLVLLFLIYAYLLDERKGQHLFEGVTAANAFAALREMLEAMDVPNASSYRTHDFRRGHVLDLQLSG